MEEIAKQPQDEDDDEEAYRPDGEFEDIPALQEHLEWQHASTSLTRSQQEAASTSQNNCLIISSLMSRRPRSLRLMRRCDRQELHSHGRVDLNPSAQIFVISIVVH